MAIPFNATATKKGLIQLIERRLGFADAFISGDTTRLARWTADINIAIDKAFHIIFGADGRWQYDDSNHTDYPIINTDIVASQRDYSFTTDANSNVILDIHKVLYRSSTTAPYVELFPVDVQQDPEWRVSSLADGLETTGQPTHYDKTANGIFLDPVPSANVTKGLKVYINREGHYFSTTDTTETAGFAGLYHEYLAVEPMYRFAVDKGLRNVNILAVEVEKLEKAITDYYSRRDKHDTTIIRNEPITYE